MKVLITGSSGLIGFNISQFYLDKGFEVIGIDNDQRKKFFGSDASNIQNLHNLSKNKSFINFSEDIRDTDAIENIFKKHKDIQLVVHAAAQPSHDWARDNKLVDFEINASSTLNLLEIIKKYSKKSKFFQPLSSNMFAQSKNKKQNETEPLTPVSVYGLGKVTAFHACKLYRDIFGLKIYGAIFYNHESEIRPEEYVTRKITRSVARIFHGKQKILKLGDVSAKIDWGYAKDYVESSYQIMQQKKPDFFIIASGKKYSVLEFVKKSFEYVGLDYKKYLRIDKKLFRPSKTVSLIGDTGKAKKIFKYKTKTNLDKLISIMMENDLNIERN